MSDQGNIPTLTDLIEKGIEIKMSDLGLDEDLQPGVADEDVDIDITEPDFDDIDENPFAAARPADDSVLDPALEQTIHRILDEHMELAFDEIRIAILRSRQGD